MSNKKITLVNVATGGKLIVDAPSAEAAISHLGIDPDVWKPETASPPPKVSDPPAPD